MFVRNTFRGIFSTEVIAKIETFIRFSHHPVLSIHDAVTRVGPEQCEHPKLRYRMAAESAAIRYRSFSPDFARAANERQITIKYLYKTEKETTSKRARPSEKSRKDAKSFKSTRYWSRHAAEETGMHV